MSNSLIIRADANDNIGSGHVMRTLALAQAWLKTVGSVTYLVSNDTNESVRMRLLDEGCSVVTNSLVCDLATDAKRLASTAKRHSATAVVIDGYHFEESYLSTVRSDEYLTLVLDDDVRLKKFDCDLLLNQNVGATEKLYTTSCETGPQLLVGTAYALLRNEFTCHNQSPKSINGNCTKVLVTMGGADTPNVTGQVIKSLQSATFTNSIRVLVGSQNQHRAELEIAAANDPQVEMIFDASDMSVHYRWADLAICAGGSSNWEMCYFGLPRIVIVQASNQIAIAENLHAQQACLYPGTCDSIDFEFGGFFDTVNSLAKDKGLRQQMSIQSQSLVDGRGVNRVVEVLTKERKVNPA